MHPSVSPLVNLDTHTHTHTPLSCSLLSHAALRFSISMAYIVRTSDLRNLQFCACCVYWLTHLRSPTSQQKSFVSAKTINVDSDVDLDGQTHTTGCCCSTIRPMDILELAWETESSTSTFLFLFFSFLEEEGGREQKLVENFRSLSPRRQNRLKESTTKSHIHEINAFTWLSPFLTNKWSISPPHTLERFNWLQ